MSEQVRPVSGPNAKNKNSKTQKKILRRTLENLTPPMKERRDFFIEGLLKGMSKYEAALYAGVPPRSARKEGCTMWCEPYVQDKFAELREAIDEGKLITRKELILNVKGIAFDAREGSGPRVSASALLARVCGFEAPTIVKNEFDMKGGVMVVPMVADADTWEKIATKSQEQLKADVRS